MTVYVPNKEADRIRIRVDNQFRHREIPISDGLVSLDLKSFSDCFILYEVASVIIEVLDRQRRVMKKGTLFSVRSKWQVENIAWSLASISDNNLLQLSWIEKGKCKSKQIRCWQVNKPWLEPTIFSLAGEDRNATIPLQAGDFQCIPFLLEFAGDDAWEWDAPQFPKLRRNTIIVTHPVNHPVFDDVMIQWRDEKTANVKGRLVNVPENTLVTIYLLGIVNGDPKEASFKAYTSKDGSFAGIIQCSGLRSFAHWLGIIAKCPDAYGYFSIIHEPAMLEWPISRPEAQAVIDKTAIRVKISSDGISLEDSILSQQVSSDILSQWVKGAGSAEFEVTIGDERQRTRMTWDETGSAIINVLYYICGTCNQIVPSQMYWGQHHYPRCKAIKTRGRHELFIHLNLVWNVGPVLQKLKDLYPLAGPYTSILHNNVLPNSIRPQEGEIDVAETVRWLCQKEIGIVDTVEGR